MTTVVFEHYNSPIDSSIAVYDQVKGNSLPISCIRFWNAQIKKCNILGRIGQAIALSLHRSQSVAKDE